MRPGSRSIATSSRKTSGTSTAQDDGERLHLPARDLFPLGQQDRLMVSGIDGCAGGACGRRPASGKFRHLARCGRPAGLGRQRFRRSRHHALYARSGPPRRQHPAGARRHDDVNDKAAAEAVLKGYREGLDHPQPALLFEGETWLWPHALPDRRQSRRISGRKSTNIRKPAPPPEIAKRALIASMPEDVDKDSIRLCTRRRAAAAWDGRVMSRSAFGAAGISCARPRRWCPRHGPGPMAPRNPGQSNFLEAANGRYRAPDPFLARAPQVHLPAPRRRLPKNRARQRPAPRSASSCCRAMGFDLASIHAAGPRGAGAIAGRSQEAAARLAERRRGRCGGGQARLSRNGKELTSAALSFPRDLDPCRFTAI